MRQKGVKKMSLEALGNLWDILSWVVKTLKSAHRHGSVVENQSTYEPGGHDSIPVRVQAQVAVSIPPAADQ